MGQAVSRRFLVSASKLLGVCLLALAMSARAETDVVSPDASAPAAAVPVAWTEVVERYVAASQDQQARLRDSTMEVDIEGRLPRLKKVASLQGIRQITTLGRVVYEGITTVGDNMVRRDVIANYVKAETEATGGEPRSGKKKLESIAITPNNYRFRYKGTNRLAGRLAHVFEVTPRQKRLGLFRGEVWVDAETYMPLRESGTFVKSPSVWLKKVHFVREYQVDGDLSMPVSITSLVETRAVGKAELDIRFRNFTLMASTRSRVCALGW